MVATVQHVVLVRILEIPVGVAVEDTPRGVDAFGIVEKRAEHRGMQHALGEPELIPVRPEAVVELSRHLRAARRTDVARIEWIEAQIRTVARTAAARA